jgi:nitrogen fixation NifU-like protein
MAFDDLYQEIILDHYRNPRNSADLSHLSEENVHENPSCGDSVKILAVVKDGKIEKLEFDGTGCAISVASASMMTEILTGKSVNEAKRIIKEFQAVMRGEADRSALDQWGELVALSGVIDFPLRVKCATLSWHALDVILQ